MKLSSRKQLLDEADKTLADIRKNTLSQKVNEIDWKQHKAWKQSEKSFQGSVPSGLRKSGAALAVDRLRGRIVRELEKRYAKLPPNSYTPEQKEAELDQLLNDVRVLKQHLDQREEIPMDPEKQTELQRYLVNHPIVTPQEIKNNPKSAVYQDPKTGLYWDINFGAPSPPPELWDLDKEEYEELKKIIYRNYDEQFRKDYPGLAEWDHSRGFFWNLFRVINTLLKFSPNV